MKQSIKIVLVLVVAVSILLGCNDSEFLETDPTKPTPAEQFSTAESAPQMVNAVYNIMLQWPFNSFSWIGISSITSDNADKGSDPGDTGADKHELDDYTFTSSVLSFVEIWDSHFQGISRANQALNILPEMNIDETLKTRLIGEAQFLRGYFYFRLVKVFGGVPIVDGIPDPSDNEVVAALNVRATLEETYAFIESDLNSAITALPEKNMQNPADLGRVTKGAAAALLAKVSMYQKKWQEVLDLTNQVITSGQYGLHPNYEELWREQTENGVESIFEVQGKGGDLALGIQGYSVSQGARGAGGWGWGFNTPTQDLIDAYESGDVRKDATIIFRGETLWDGRVVAVTVSNPYYNEKAYATKSPDAWETSKNIRVLRYAEVLLMNAEAANELGNTAQAITNLNLVRNRAALGNTTASTQSELRMAIWKERRVELAFEHDRIFDIIRQGRAGQIMRAHGKPFVDGKHELFPIPNEQVDLSNGTLVQNPGY